MKLFIVESPAKARKIQTFLGSEFHLEATMGHFMELPEHQLGVDVENGFTPTYVVKNGKSEVITKLQNLAEHSDEIMIASDMDREGEAIAAHIVDILSPQARLKCKRVVYHEITKKAILQAIANYRSINVNLVNAAKARQVLDRLIGYKVSPILWNTVGKGTSAGRVQSVALKIICDRQREIEAFKPIIYWYVDVLLKGKAGEFWARVVVPKDKDNRFSDKKLATETLNKLRSATYTMGGIQKATKSVQPFPPFDTNSLQGTCSTILKWDITKSMKVAQSLYEQGKCSYIRTDSFNVSDEALADVRHYISGQHGASYLPIKANIYAKKAAAATQEAHECIRPTHIEDAGLDLAEDDRKMYELIRNRFIACQMSPMIVDSVKYLVDTDCDEKLIASGQSIAFDGFSKVWKYKSTKEIVLPQVVKGDILSYKDAKQTENKTKPPDRYTDASLANKLETDGVGRPATRAPIIKSLETKGYVIKDKNFLAPTEIGYSIVDFLDKIFMSSFMDIKFTAGMESEMVKIAEGESGFEDVVSSFYETLMTDVGKIQGVKKTAVNMNCKCNVCGEGEILQRTGKFGTFFTCSKYPDCKTIFDKTDDGSFVPKDKKPLQDMGKQCPECKIGKIVLRKGTYGNFYACSNFPACQTTFRVDGDKFIPKTSKMQNVRHP